MHAISMTWIQQRIDNGSALTQAAEEERVRMQDEEHRSCELRPQN